MVFADMLQIGQQIQRERFTKMFIDMALRFQNGSRKHKGCLRIGAGVCQKFGEDICDELRGDQLRGDICFLMDRDNAPERELHGTCVLTLQQMKAVFDKFLIITKGMGTVEVHPQKFPLTAWCTLIKMTFIAVDETGKTGSEPIDFFLIAKDPAAGDREDDKKAVQVCALRVVGSIRLEITAFLDIEK